MISTIYISSTIITSCLVIFHLAETLPHRTIENRTSLNDDDDDVAHMKQIQNLRLRQQQQQQQEQHIAEKDSFLWKPFHESLSSSSSFHHEKRMFISGVPSPSTPKQSLLQFRDAKLLSDDGSPVAAAGSKMNATIGGRGKRSASRRSTSSLPRLSGGGSGNEVIDACEEVKEWVQLREAEDMWGVRLTVLQEFENGSTRVNQYFYETRCRHSPGTGTGSERPSSCTGTDTTVYDSVCLEKHAWVYAKVLDRDDNGNNGERWTFIKIRTSCNCGLIRKNVSLHSRRSTKVDG